MKGIRLSKYNRVLINRHKYEFNLLYEWYINYKKSYKLEKEHKIINNMWVYPPKEVIDEYIEMTDKYCNFKVFPKPYKAVSITTVNGGTFAGYCNENKEWLFNNCDGEQVRVNSKVLFWRYDKHYRNKKVSKGNIIEEKF